MAIPSEETPDEGLVSDSLFSLRLVCDADAPLPICKDNPGRRGAALWPCDGTVEEPIGVFSRSAGGIGRCSAGTAAASGASPTARVSGEGGIASERPSLGVLLPLLVLPPGIGGRRRGTGVPDIIRTRTD